MKSTVEQEGYKRYLLWTNSNPSAEFASRTITLSDNSSNYDYILVDFVYVTNDSRIYTSIVSVYKDRHGAFNVYTIDGNGGFVNRSGYIHQNASNATFFDCDHIVGATRTTTNAFMIPYKIYGIKLK